MVDWSGNGLSMTWKKLRMLPTRILLTNFTQYIVSKVLLLFVAILWLLGRLGPKWTSFLESSWLCVGSPEMYFSLASFYLSFQFVPKMKKKKIPKRMERMST